MAVSVDLGNIGCQAEVASVKPMTSQPESRLCGLTMANLVLFSSQYK